MQTLSPVKAAKREIFIDVLKGCGEALPIKNGNLSEKLKSHNSFIL